METRTLAALPITEPSQVSEARRLAIGFARRLDFDETDTGRVAIFVTEAGTNMVKHARDGLLVLNALSDGRMHGLGMLALDHGPGIANLGASLRDGYSTTGSMGGGLGAIMRMSSEFDIYSAAGLGTAVLARLWPGRVRPVRNDGCVDLGAVAVATSGEEVCGDAWAHRHQGASTRIILADGLGHGIDASEAAVEAVRVFYANPDLEPGPLLHVIDAALRHTRGAVVEVAVIDAAACEVRFAGVGNAAGIIVSPDGERSMASYNGTLGHQVRKIQEFTYPWPEQALLVLHSDGIAKHWDFENYPGLIHRHPSLIAGVIYRDCRRARDDATVVVAKAAGATR